MISRPLTHAHRLHPSTPARHGLTQEPLVADGLNPLQTRLLASDASPRLEAAEGREWSKSERPGRGNLDGQGRGSQTRGGEVGARRSSSSSSVALRRRPSARPSRRKLHPTRVGPLDSRAGRRGAPPSGVRGVGVTRPSPGPGGGRGAGERRARIFCGAGGGHHPPPLRVPASLRLLLCTRPPAGLPRRHCESATSARGAGASRLGTGVRRGAGPASRVEPKVWAARTTGA